MKFTFLSRFFKRRKTNEYNLSPKTDSARIERVFLNFAQKIRVLTDDSSDEEEIEANKNWEKDKKDESSAIFINAKAKTIFKWKKKIETSIPMVHTREIDCKMFAVLEFMNNSIAAKDNQFKIMHGYDYAWIKKAIKIQPKLKSNDAFVGYTQLLNYTDKEFVEYIKGLGFDNICGYKNLKRYYQSIEGKWPELEFKHDISSESERRRRIFTWFIELMNAIC